LQRDRGKYLARVPAFQVDRAALDEEVLRRAWSWSEIVAAGDRRQNPTDTRRPQWWK